MIIFCARHCFLQLRKTAWRMKEKQSEGKKELVKFQRFKSSSRNFPPKKRTSDKGQRAPTACHVFVHARKGGSHLCIRSKEPLAPTRAPPRDVHSVSCIRACKRKRKPLMHSSFKSTGRVINASGASAQALEYSRLRFVAAIKTHDDILFAVNRVSCTYFCR